MRQSELFTKTRRENPQDEVAKNAQLLVRAGFIHKELAGVYSYLPLGLKTLNKIIGIIREEMLALGGQEVFLTSLQEPEKWQKSGRWSDEVVDIWFKTKLGNETELGLANTHEEALASLMKEQISSYKDLPKYVFQFQTKFRNEKRAKSGLLRTREFIMKDLYSFSKTEEELANFYDHAAQAYEKIFKRVGLGEVTYKTFASGGSFSQFSHEFQTLCEAGEDLIYVDEGKGVAVNKEVLTDEVLSQLNLDKDNLKEKKAIEVGNIFKLGTKYSEALGLNYKNESGEVLPVVMGSYGIGPGRLLGTMAEVLSDDKGLVWPEAVSPFQVHLISLGQSEAVKAEADKIYADLVKKGEEVLYDDRDLAAGEKFADADLIGLPKRIVVSEKTLASGKLEVKDRASGETIYIDHVWTIERNVHCRRGTWSRHF